MNNVHSNFTRVLVVVLFGLFTTSLFANGQEEVATSYRGGGRGYGRMAAEGTVGQGAYGQGLNPALGNSYSQAQPYRVTELAALEAMPKESLSTQEIAELLYIYEEEKLAKDVYTALGEIHGIPVFSNIARSEQTHQDQIAYILDRYELEIPETGTPGVYENAELNAAYADLMSQGTASFAGAIDVGIAIEVMDIDDLEVAIGLTDNQDVEYVLNQLLMGSKNHLAAFERQAGR